MKKYILLIWLTSLSIIACSQIILQSSSQLIISNAHIITANGIVNNDGSIDMTSSAIIENRGNLENNSSGLFTSTSTGTLKFNGNSAQEITGDHDAEFYGTVEIDNPNGVSITNSATGDDQTINGTLVFTNGIFTLNEFNLTLANDFTTSGTGHGRNRQRCEDPRLGLIQFQSNRREGTVLRREQKRPDKAGQVRI